jgi:hypothetical protein
MEFQKPTFLPLYNPSRFSTKQSLKSIRKQSLFPAGITVPFIVFEDGSVQRSATARISYITENTQLASQPYNPNYIVKDNNVEAIYLPNDAPKMVTKLKFIMGRRIRFCSSVKHVKCLIRPTCLMEKIQ